MTVGGGVTLTLTGAQRDYVVRAAAGAGSLDAVLSGFAPLERAFAGRPGMFEDPRMSRSLLLGLLLLAALGGDSLSVSGLAKRVGLSASTTHRYLATLVVAGLVEQDARSRRYWRIELPPQAGEAA